MDKPAPPRQTFSVPLQYQQDSRVEPAPDISNKLIDSVSNTILSAYKINPIVITILLLGLTVLGAVGFYIIRNEERIAAYIAERDQQQANLWERLVAMAKDCRTIELNKEAYPPSDIPKTTTKPQPTLNKQGGK